MAFHSYLFKSFVYGAIISEGALWIERCSLRNSKSCHFIFSRLLWAFLEICTEIEVTPHHMAEKFKIVSLQIPAAFCLHFGKFI